MALVNAAYTLVKQGKNVLVVDFDLEAPGLDTFDVLKPSKKTLGLIEFVDQYLRTGQAPHAVEYISECSPIDQNGGSLRIMPSGNRDNYAVCYNRIDWIDLYDKNDGFLLFEDLKQQWKDEFNPDYVLIDSRTGLTDTSGICTRQLADSVVLFFFPNQQNLYGLKDVVNDIRNEQASDRKKGIELHFVMSNVPDLDDEHQILENIINEFKVQLGCRENLIVVNRYDSLSLLSQSVFCKDRPKSRLAAQYRKIVREISMHNPNDRDGALEFIQRIEQPWRWRGRKSMLKQQGMLDNIHKAHPNDGEILYLLGKIKERMGDLDQALSIINQSIDAGYDKPEAYLKRSRFREFLKQHDSESVKSDVLRVLEFKDISPSMLRESLSRLMQMDELAVAQAVQCPAVSSLDSEDKIWLAEAMDRSDGEIQFSMGLLEQLLNDDKLSEGHSEEVKHLLGLFYMGQGRCREASKLFQVEDQERASMDIQQIFNSAMSEWGATGKVDRESFRHVVALHHSDLLECSRIEMPNYLQCMAIAHWAIADNSSALDFLNQAEQAIKYSTDITAFSAWRYREVSCEEFLDDIESIRALFEGKIPMLPKYASLEK